MPIPDAKPSEPAAHAAPAPARDPRMAERFEPLAGLLAMLAPGLGHLALGQPARAGFIAAGVLGLFLGGILIGGVDVIDRKEDTIWFAGQALVGPLAFGVDYFHQNHLKVRDRMPDNPERHAGARVPGNLWLRSPDPDEARDPSGAALKGDGMRPPSSKSLGRMNELGTLFATIAGMLNLIVIIDAFYHARPRPE
jgi:hypothetical protein